MRRLMFLSVLLSTNACSSAEQVEELRFEVSGRLESDKIREASGLARSLNQADVLWIINDNGNKDLVHAIDHTGARLGEFDVKKASNKDWEDLASLTLDDTNLLMIADIGDNEAQRKKRTLYFVEEPVPAKKDSKKRLWEIDYRYPDGPRDAESAAVDIDAEQALVLSKRDLPPRLYAVPLRPGEDEVVEAEALGTVNTLPKPTRQEIEFAPKLNDWFWQPVGMDIAADNRAAVILTYRAVFYYERSGEQQWIEALNNTPLRISLGNFKNAESIAFADDNRTIVVTGENKHSRILRIDLSGALGRH